MPNPTISTRPSITPELYGFTSEWNAGGGDLPIQYKIANTKFPTNSEDDLETYSSVNNDGGFAKLILDSYPANVMVVGDYVTVTGSVYSGVFKVTGKDGDDLTLDAPYVSTDSGTAIRYLRNYRTVVKVYAGIYTDHPLTADDPIELIGTIEQKPNASNITAVDIHKYVKRKLESKNDLTQTSLPNDLNGWCDFYIEYKELYDVAGAESGSGFADDSGNFVGHAVNGALQFQNTYGGNYYEYVMSDEQDIESKWLTFFTTGYHVDPRAWDASLIHDNGEFIVGVTQYDKNTVLLRTDYFIFTGRGRGLYRFLASQITFDASTYTFDLQVLDAYTDISTVFNVELGNVCSLRIPPADPLPPETEYFPAGFNDVVTDVVVDSNGDFIFVGAFTAYGSTLVNRIVKLFGHAAALPYTIDTSFDVGTGLTGAGGTNFKLTINTDDSIFLYGDNIDYNSAAYNGELAKLLTDGSVDGTFSSGAIDQAINTIAVDEVNDLLYIGGGFNTVQGHNTKAVAVLTLSTGIRDATFSAGFGFSGQVQTVLYDSIGEIFVSGPMGSYSGTQTKGIAKLRTTGTLDNPPFITTTGCLDGVTSRGAHQMVLDESGEPMIVGRFDSYKAVTRYGIAKVDKDDASLITAFDPSSGFQGMTADDDLLMTSLSSDTVTVFGKFNEYAGETRYNLCEINKTTGAITSTFNGTSQFYTIGLLQGKVNTVKLLSDGRYLIGGDFIEYGNTTSLYFVILSV